MIASENDASLAVILTDGSHLPVFIKHLELDLIPRFAETIVVSLCKNDNHFLKSIEDKCTVIDLSPKDFASFYYSDCSETFGSENHEIKWTGPFSSEMKILNWAKVRNLSFSRCSRQYRVVVYEDEIIDDPENINKLIQAVRDSQSEVGYTRKHSNASNGYVPRVSVNDPKIRWFGSVDETIDGIRKYITSDVLRSKVFSNLSNGFEKLSTLYANATFEKWNVYPRDLINLAKYASPFYGITKSTRLITDYLDISLYTEERAWACAVWGELLEKAGMFEDAAFQYRASMSEHPGWKSAMRLCRILFNQQKFDQVLEVFSEGVQNIEVHHLIDDGCESIEKTMLLVAVSNYRLGYKQEALENCNVLKTLFPFSRKINAICEKIEKNDLV